MFKSLLRLRTLATVTALALTAACSLDRTSDPLGVDAAPSMNLPEAPSLVRQHALVAPEASPATTDGRFHTMAAVYPSDAKTYQFTVDPTKASAFIMGIHMVTFPANTICDPKSSSYGPGTWLSKCSLTKSKFTITATAWVDAAGRPHIDFANALRFMADKNGTLPAIYLRDPAASNSAMGRIDYCSSAGACVNEAATDSELVTRRESTTGYLYRFIRHFSGYNVWA